MFKFEVGVTGTEDDGEDCDELQPDCDDKLTC